jgi:hypothetical protein
MRPTGQEAYGWYIDTILNVPCIGTYEFERSFLHNKRVFGETACFPFRTGEVDTIIIVSIINEAKSGFIFDPDKAVELRHMPTGFIDIGNGLPKKAAPK